MRSMGFLDGTTIRTYYKVARVAKKREYNEHCRDCKDLGRSLEVLAPVIVGMPHTNSVNISGNRTLGLPFRHERIREVSCPK